MPTRDRAQRSLAKIGNANKRKLEDFIPFLEKNNQSILTEKNHKKNIVPYPIAPRGAL